MMEKYDYFGNAKENAEAFLDDYCADKEKVTTFRGVDINDFSKEYLVKLLTFMHKEMGREMGAW